MTTTPSNTQKIKFRLIMFLILISIAFGGYYAVNTFLPSNPEIKDVQIDSKAAQKLNSLETISKKNGITEWEVKASSATLMKDESILVLLDINVIFHTKDKKTIRLTSKKGTLNTKTNDMTFSDDVVTIYETFTLKTDKLHYKKKEHIIYSKSTVRLEKVDSVIEADSMITELSQNKTTLKGNVKGKFSEKFDLL
jgi:LPS export ABC transporter protein LptC